MVTESEVLLVDAGNSSIKYVSLKDINDSIHTAASPQACFDTLKNSQPAKFIFLSNVGKASIEEQFHHYCAQNQIQLRVIETEKHRFSLTNAYSDVTKMGVDRWLAMLAAHTMTDRAFAVIDVGTAITCDFVADGQHLGGWITPGYGLMKDALVKNTAKVIADNQIPTDFGIGQSTQDCVALGCQAAVHGVYLSAVDYLSSKHDEFSIIIGGGGKNMLAFAQFDGSILVANLVVHGLARYARRELQALLF